MEQIARNNLHTIAEKRLGVLVGTRLTKIVRCVDMEMFRFGPLHSVVVKLGRKKGQFVEKPEFSLHVQCPWRMTKGHQIVTGDGDHRILVEWIDTTHLSPAEIEQLPRWSERRIAELQKSKPNGLLVTQVGIDETKSVKIGFEDDYNLTVFPTSSAPDDNEYWRFISLGIYAHLVASSGGLAEEGSE